MDESWRMKMGVPAASGGSTALEPEDFNDIFGGPPRSLLARKLSADFSGNDWFYNDIFRPLDSDSSEIISGRRLPEFMIPEKNRSKNKQVNKMCRSKSTSSSVISFDESLYQLNSFGAGTIIGEDDVALSSLTTKLRPINVPSRRTTSSTSIIPKNNNNMQDLPAFGNECNDFMIQSFNFGHQQTLTSPQAINTEHTNFNKQPVNIEYHMQVSPSSPVSSLCQHLEGRTNNFNHQEDVVHCQHHVQVEDHVVSSYDHAENSPRVEVNNAKAIDIGEAIAWAKDKFQGWSLNDEGACLKEHETSSFFAR